MDKDQIWLIQKNDVLMIVITLEEVTLYYLQDILRYQKRKP